MEVEFAFAVVFVVFDVSFGDERYVVLVFL